MIVSEFWLYRYFSSLYFAYFIYGNYIDVNMIRQVLICLWQVPSECEISLGKQRREGT